MDRLKHILGALFLLGLILATTFCFGQRLAMAPYIINPFIHSYYLVTDHTQTGSTNTSNFPCLVSLTLTSLKTVSHGGSVKHTTTFNSKTVPADVVFSLSSSYSSLLNYDIESYDSVNGIIVAWVNIVTLSHTINDTLYMGVGSSSIITYQGGSVGAAWDASYGGVWHMSDGLLLSSKDATSNANNGTIVSATATSGSGLTDGAMKCATTANATTNYMTAPNNSAYYSTSGFTAQFIVYLNTGASVTNNSGNVMLATGPFTDVKQFYLLPGGNTICLVLNYNSMSGIYYGIANALQDNTWYWIVLTWDGSTTWKIYQNAVLQQTITGKGSSSNSNTIYMGQYSGLGTNALDGNLDEVRLSSVTRSPDQITAEYNNQKPGSTFVTTTLIY